MEYVAEEYSSILFHFDLFFLDLIFTGERCTERKKQGERSRPREEEGAASAPFLDKGVRTTSVCFCYVGLCWAWAAQTDDSADR